MRRTKRAGAALLLACVGPFGLLSGCQDAGDLSSELGGNRNELGEDGADLYVDDDAACPGEGTFDAPYCHPQDAVDDDACAGPAGCTVHVQPGTYTGGLVIGSDWTRVVGPGGEQYDEDGYIVGYDDPAVIVGEDFYGNAVLVLADHVEFGGFEVQSGTITAAYVRDTYIHDAVITGDVAVWLDDGRVERTTSTNPGFLGGFGSGAPGQPNVATWSMNRYHGKSNAGLCIISGSWRPGEMTDDSGSTVRVFDNDLSYNAGTTSDASNPNNTGDGFQFLYRGAFGASNPFTSVSGTIVLEGNRLIGNTGSGISFFPGGDGRAASSIRLVLSPTNVVAGNANPARFDFRHAFATVNSINYFFYGDAEALDREQLYVSNSLVSVSDPARLLAGFQYDNPNWVDDDGDGVAGEDAYWPADQDGDGLHGEEILFADGVDNDGDGQIDEDYQIIFDPELGRQVSTDIDDDGDGRVGEDPPEDNTLRVSGHTFDGCDGDYFVGRSTCFDAPAQATVTGGTSISFDVDFGYTGAYDAMAYGLSGPPEIAEGSVANQAWSLGAAVSVPAGTTALRFDLYGEEPGKGHDLDLEVYEEYLEDGNPDPQLRFVGGGYTGTATESVSFSRPVGPGTPTGNYQARVFGWYVDGEEGYVVPYTVTSWTDDAAPLVVTEAPTEAVAGTTGTVVAEWPSGLPSGSYFGLVEHLREVVDDVTGEVTTLVMRTTSLMVEIP